MSDPQSTYLQMKDDLQRVLALPLEGKEDLFRDVLVGYLVVEHHYSEARAVKLVAGNEAAILFCSRKRIPLACGKYAAEEGLHGASVIHTT